MSEKTDKRKIILDCDPGHDDAMAIILALASEKIDLLAVTTSAGNQTQQKTLNNALRLLSFLGRTDIPVASGNVKPLVRDLFIADYVHGETGLDGADLGPKKFAPVKETAVELMKKVLEESEDKVTLVVTGPMTNAAMLLSVYPQVKEKIQCISFMGGACFGGNVTPTAEFNIYVDPEAAKIVFNSGVPLIMCGLDVTLRAQIFPDEVQQIREIGNDTGKVMADLLDFFSKSTSPYFLAEEGHVEGLHMHDPCAIAILIDHDRFITRKCFGDVETGGEYGRGCTVIDYNHVLDRKPNVEVAFRIDREWFVNLLKDSISKFR